MRRPCRVERLGKEPAVHVNAGPLRPAGKGADEVGQWQKGHELSVKKNFFECFPVSLLLFDFLERCF